MNKDNFFIYCLNKMAEDSTWMDALESYLHRPLTEKEKKTISQYWADRYCTGECTLAAFFAFCHGYLINNENNYELQEFWDYCDDHHEWADKYAYEKDVSFEEESDNVNHPAHYNTMQMEVYDIIQMIVEQYSACPSEVHYSLGNVLKYICRAPHKGALVEDLKKAQWYLNKCIERMEE